MKPREGIVFSGYKIKFSSLLNCHCVVITRNGLIYPEAIEYAIYMALFGLEKGVEMSIKSAMNKILKRIG